MPKLLILGAGTHARVVLDCLRAAGRGADVLGMVEVDGDRKRWGKSLDGCRVLGGLNRLASFAQGAGQAALGYGENVRRGELMALARKHRLALPALVHPDASVSPRARLGPGSQVLAGAVVVTGASLGAGVIVNTAATVDHDCRLAACVHVAPGAHLAGNVVVGRLAWVGIGASVREGSHIGTEALIGAGAAVVNDVRPGARVVGVPARPI